jgi:hypothetical protein
VPHLVSSSTPFVFLTNMSEKRKFTSPGAHLVKIRQETVGTEEKLDVITRLEKGDCIVEIHHNI